MAEHQMSEGHACRLVGLAIGFVVPPRPQSAHGQWRDAKATAADASQQEVDGLVVEYFGVCLGFVVIVTLPAGIPTVVTHHHLLKQIEVRPQEHHKASADKVGHLLERVFVALLGQLLDGGSLVLQAEGRADFEESLVALLANFRKKHLRDLLDDVSGPRFQRRGERSPRRMTPSSLLSAGSVMETVFENCSAA